MTMADGVKQAVRRRRQEPPEPEEVPGGLSTGSTLLNLSLSDHGSWGFAKGKLINLVGDSSSGKTVLALTSLAEAAHSDEFSDHRLIFDDVEAALEFNIDHLFGPKLSDRIRGPNGPLDEPSDTIEGFSDSIHTLLKEGEPFIYILDSLDALTSEEEQDKQHKQQLAREKGKEAAGTYGLAKAKLLTQILRLIARQLKGTGSILIIISQTRENISPLSFDKKYRAGGKALKFYSCHEIWTAVKETLKRKQRMVGILCAAKVSKNKLTGKQRKIEFPIYYDYGVDDIGSCVDFLCAEGVWSEGKKGIECTLYDEPMQRGALLRAIEESESKVKALRKEVAKAWEAIEGSIRSDRKRRYQ